MEQAEEMLERQRVEDAVRETEVLEPPAYCEVVNEFSTQRARSCSMTQTLLSDSMRSTMTDAGLTLDQVDGYRDDPPAYSDVVEEPAGVHRWPSDR